MQFELFIIPVSNAKTAISEMNVFLRSHKIITVNKEFIPANENSFYSILIEYISNAYSDVKSQPIDYKEILSAEDFSLFSYLREIRKKLAKEFGVPVYVIVNNAEMAEIARLKPKNIQSLASIQGIGKGKCEKYGNYIIQALEKYEAKE